MGQPQQGPEIRSYRDLAAWQRAMELVEGVYTVTRRWPREETYGLTNQVRRAAVSVPANIAEGQGRRNPREFARFLKIATGSLFEVETHLLIAQRWNIWTTLRCVPFSYFLTKLAVSSAVSSTAFTWILSTNN